VSYVDLLERSLETV